MFSIYQNQNECLISVTVLQYSFNSFQFWVKTETNTFEKHNSPVTFVTTMESESECKCLTCNQKPTGQIDAMKEFNMGNTAFR